MLGSKVGRLVSDTHMSLWVDMVAREGEWAGFLRRGFSYFSWAFFMGAAVWKVSEAAHFATARSPRSPMDGDRGGESTSLFAQPHPWLPRVASFDLLASAPASSSNASASAADLIVKPLSDLVAPRWHAPSPGTDLNKPPRDINPSNGFLAAWQPYRLFPTHQPQRGRGTAPPDFVATADNLKALLQMPWTNQPVSLAVHRCGSTLLLDDVNERQANAMCESLGGPGFFAGDPHASAPHQSHGLPRRPPPGFPADYSRLRRPSIDTVTSGSSSPRPVGSYAAAAAAAAPPIGPTRTTTGGHRQGESQAVLEAKLLYHSLSVEAGLGRLDIRGPDGAPAGDGTTDRTRNIDACPDDDDDDRSRMRRPPAVIHLPPPPPKPGASGPPGALQLRGPARAVADAMVSSAASTQLATGDEDAPNDGGDGTKTPSEAGAAASGEAFGQPHLFEWEVHGHRLLVESSLVVFRREGRTPMSLKLVDLDADRPNTGTALSTWLDNAIAGVPELAVCYHRGGLIHHYDVLQTDDIARLCAPPFDPDVILTYAARVLEFLQHHCKDDGSQYWLLGDGSREGGLHLYDVTKGVVTASSQGGGGGGGGMKHTTSEDSSDNDDDDDVDDGDDGQRALPAPGPIRLPWVDRSERHSGTVTPGSEPGASTGHNEHVSANHHATTGDRPNDGASSLPGVAGALGRYALLERVAAVLSPTDHPAMFSAYKEELASACLAGISDEKAPNTDVDTDDTDDWGWSRDRRLSPGADPTPPSSGKGDLRQGVGPRLARKALGHLAEATAALTAALKSMNGGGERGDHGENSAGAGEPDSSPPGSVGPRTHLRRVLAARCACKIGIARAMYRAGNLGGALAVAESAAVDDARGADLLHDAGDPETTDENKTRTALGPGHGSVCAILGDVHAELRGDDENHALARREWETARSRLARDGEPEGSTQRATGEPPGGNGDRDGSAAMGHPPPSAFLGRGPVKDARSHAAAAEACYASAATHGTTSIDTKGVWRRYGALRNERGKGALREAMEMSVDADDEVNKAGADFALQCAETCYADASVAFERAKDRVNAALVALNRAQACRARAAWSLPRSRETTAGEKGRADDGVPPGLDGWRLREFESAAGHCRRALQSLSREDRNKPPPQGVIAAVRAELGNALLASGLEFRRLGVDFDAASRMEEAIRTLQVGCVGSPAGAASLATAHYHLGGLLADAALARAAETGPGDEDSHGANNKFLPAQRHLERALVGFPPNTAPLDHVRLRVRLAGLADAAGEGAVRGGGGGVAGVGHREAAAAHLLSSHAAFASAPPGAEGEQGWIDARHQTETMLLAVLKNLVQSSVGGKRHGGHRDLYSRALRGFGTSLREFSSRLRELEDAARVAHVMR